MRLPENLYKCPDDAWTTPMGIGAFAIRFSEPRRPEITAHCYDFARELNDKHLPLVLQLSLVPILKLQKLFYVCGLL